MSMRRAAAALSALLVMLCTAGCGVFGGQPMMISAQFQDSVGLFVGNDVSVLGIKVGTVTAIHPAGTHVVVDLAVDPATKIPAGVSAVTMSPSVVTDRRVELTPVYRGGPTLRPGDIIPLDRTRTPVEADRIFEAADRLAKQLNDPRIGQPTIAEALDATAGTFAGNGDKLHKATQGLAAAVGVGADQKDAIVSLIKDADHLTQVAANNDGLIRSFGSNVADATQLLNEQGPHLTDLLNNIDEVLDRTNRIIEDNRKPFESSLDNLKGTVRTAKGRTREFKETLDVLPTTLQNVANIVDPGRGKARVHAGLDQILLDTQIMQGICQRYAPQLCSSTQSPMTSNAGLAKLFMGAAR